MGSQSTAVDTAVLMVAEGIGVSVELGEPEEPVLLVQLVVADHTGCTVVELRHIGMDQVDKH